MSDSMDISKVAMKFKSYVFILSVFSLVMVSSADTASISAAIRMLCSLFYTILPIGVLLAITLAGVIFAIGQSMGAETRARANVWATNLMIGALIAGVVTVLAPSVLQILLGNNIDFSQSCAQSSP